MIARYRLSAGDFTALAAGYGGASALAVLASAQLSKHVLLLADLVRNPADGRGSRAAASEVSAASEVLAAADRADPVAVSAVLADPCVGAWLSRCLRSPERRESLAGHVAGVAAVAAAAAGVDADLTVPVTDGTVWLPTRGVAHVPDAAAARVEVRGGALTVHYGSSTLRAGPDAPGWHGLRHVAGRWPSPVALLDVGPFRDCYRLPLAGRLDAAAVDRWAALFRDATALIGRHAPARAVELAGGLRALVPLARAAGRPGLSATTRDAFGAFALTAPADPASFAVTIVHEFQHSKLGALLDLVPLYARGGARRYRVPWRPDPRPVGNALQGVYAFLAVAETWGALRADPASSTVAERQFGTILDQVADGLRTLSTADEWTPDGRRFLAVMRDRHAAISARRRGRRGRRGRR